MLALFEIAGTVYVMFYGPKEHIRETSKILTLIAVSLNVTISVQ